MRSEDIVRCGRPANDLGAVKMSMILIESFDLNDLREYECMVCLEKTPLVLGEKWQICANFHFTKTKTIEGTDRTLAPIAEAPHPRQ